MGLECGESGHSALDFLHMLYGVVGRESEN